MPSGCAFHPRCQYTIDICKEEVPEYQEIEQDHFIRCHRWDDIQQE
ncbi:MAG: oligopeptide/dipeptide ABC transporter ATP-binding protein [Candidatus Thorarchaeota archaeon]